MQSFSLTMQDILPLLPLDTVVKGRSVDLPCPACNDTKKHLNINLEKMCSAATAVANTAAF